MALLENLKFWKKDEPDELPGTPFPETSPIPPAPGGDILEQTTPGAQPLPSEKPFSFDKGDLSLGTTPPPQQQGGRDLEIISIKLDAIKTTLESINLRLERIEHAAGITK